MKTKFNLFKNNNVKNTFTRHNISKTEYRSMSPNSIDYLTKLDNKKQTIAGMTDKQWKELFGKCDFEWRNEHRLKFYSFKDQDNNIFLVYGGKGKGSGLESNLNIDSYLKTGKVSDEIKQKVLDFIDFLFQQLLTLDDEKVNFWKDINI